MPLGIPALTGPTRRYPARPMRNRILYGLLANLFILSSASARADLLCSEVNDLERRSEVDVSGARIATLGHAGIKEVRHVR